MLRKFTTINCLGYNIFSDKIENISLDRDALITTINQYSYCLGEKNELFKEALRNSDILLPDGVGITHAVKLLGDKDIKKIAGADIHQYLLEKLNQIGGRCFYMGSSPSTLATIRERIHREYPAINVEVYSPPFKKVFSERDNQNMIRAINSFKPDVLFVGMTAPKQEQWAYQNRPKLDARIICCIGAVFDFYAQTVERPKDIWINMGLEWLIRLIKEPKRMAVRYLYYGPVYLWMILKMRIKGVH